MKHIMSITGSIFVFGIFSVFSSATAEETAQVFEMAESGLTIEFYMSPGEIAEKKKSVVMRKLQLKNDIKRSMIFEMGESGQTVEFAMTPKEIATEANRKAELSTIQETKAKKSKKTVTGFELAESGIIIEFPVTSSEISKEKQANN